MAGSKSNSFETEILELIFQNADLPDVGDATGLQGSSTAGNLYIALYVDGTEPSEGGPGVECSYTGYARKAVVRSAEGWTVADGVCSNAAAITFDQCSGGSESAGAFAICKGDEASDDEILYWGELTSPLAISAGITPEFAIGDLEITED